MEVVFHLAKCSKKDKSISAHFQLFPVIIHKGCLQRRSSFQNYFGLFQVRSAAAYKIPAAAYKGIAAAYRGSAAAYLMEKMRIRPTQPA